MASGFRFGKHTKILCFNDFNALFAIPSLVKPPQLFPKCNQLPNLTRASRIWLNATCVKLAKGYSYQYHTSARHRYFHPTNCSKSRSFNLSIFVRPYSNSTQSCWKCGKTLDPVKEQFICQCGVLQPPTENRNFFEILGISEKFDIDINDLTTKFRKLQAILHPDKFSTKPQIEKDHSANQSSLVNKAYQTLLKPLSRGSYLLELYNESIEEGEMQMDSDFLVEIMEKNEVVDSATVVSEFKVINQENNKIIDELVEETRKAFEDSDIALAKQKLSKLRYYYNIQDQLKEKMHSIHD